MTGLSDGNANRTQPPELTRAFTQATGSRVRRKSSTRPFSIRLSETERHQLEQAAGTVPLGTFVRARLLGERPTRRTARRPIGDTVTLGKILAAMGQSGLASSLTDLATAARLGTIALTPELEAALEAAFAEVRDIRRLLLRALGMAVESPS
jgi:hypothetical protein